MNKVNSFLEKNKKFMLIAPIVLVAIFLLSFYFLPNKQEGSKKQFSEVDNSLPSSDTVSLFENKTDTYNQVEDFKAAEKKDAEKGENIDFGENTTNVEKYQSPQNDEVANKLEKMLSKLEQSKKKRNEASNSYSKRVSAPSTNISSVPDNVTPTPEVVVEENKSLFNKKSSNGNNGQTDELIYAVVRGDQNIKNGERVTLALTKDATINGKLYKRNTLVYGFATFSQNRVNLKITNISSTNVNLIANDAQDGTPGIYIEGQSLVKEAASEMEDQGVNDVDLSGIPLGNTVKKIFKKKKKENRVLLLNNYKLILKTK